MTRRGAAGRGGARLGSAWQGKASGTGNIVAARQGKAGRGEAGRGWARQGKARQG
jgi:hypothetical protein